MVFKSIQPNNNITSNISSSVVSDLSMKAGEKTWTGSSIQHRWWKSNKREDAYSTFHRIEVFPFYCIMSWPLCAHASWPAATNVILLLSGCSRWADRERWAAGLVGLNNVNRLLSYRKKVGQFALCLHVCWRALMSPLSSTRLLSPSPISTLLEAFNSQSKRTKRSEHFVVNILRSHIWA